MKLTFLELETEERRLYIEQAAAQRNVHCRYGGQQWRA